jgi:hypothetical protein
MVLNVEDTLEDVSKFNAESNEEIEMIWTGNWKLFHKLVAIALAYSSHRTVVAG